MPLIEKGANFRPDGTLPNGVSEARHTSRDRSAYSLAQESFEKASIPLLDKLEAFPRFTTKRSIARFLAKNEIFKQILDVAGVVVECGVLNGGGLFTWAQLSNIYEPVNYTRKVIGFDTFEGFPSVHATDNTGVLESKKGDLRGSSVEDLQLSVQKLDSERALGHIPVVSFVKGDIASTARSYLEGNPHLVIALLYLDFDLYEPTKLALELFLPRMPKGAIVAFDELNCESYPGETLALNETLSISGRKIHRFPFDPWTSYIQL